MAIRRGTLEVVIPYDSQVLSRSLPVEVRNQHHMLVATITAEQSIKLAEGLYSVTAVLDSGQRVTRPVHVKHAETSRVLFRSEPAANETTGSESWYAAPACDAANALVARLFSEQTVDHAALRALLEPPPCAGADRDGQQIWIAAGSPNLSLGHAADHRIIHARFAGESQPCWVVLGSSSGVVYQSLPLSREPECDECTLTVRPARGRLEVEIALSPERKVGRALHALIDTGKLGLGVDLARPATQLVAGEAADPITAAYGALLLQRAGVAGERARAIARLARDFAWIPDGRIVHAALLSRSRRRADVLRGHLLLLEATRTPPLFSDALSLALALLRRWPAKAGEDERRARLAELAGMVAHCDFNAPFTTLQWSSAEIRAHAGPAAGGRDAETPRVDSLDAHVLPWLAEVVVGHYVERGVALHQVMDAFAVDNCGVAATLGDAGLAALAHLVRTEHGVPLPERSPGRLVDHCSRVPMFFDVDQLQNDLATLQASAVASQFGPAEQPRPAEEPGPAGEMTPAAEARLRQNIVHDYEEGLGVYNLDLLFIN